MKGELTCYDKTTCRFAEEVRELRAALEAASVSVSRMTNRALKQELRAERAEAALAMYSKLDGDDGLASANRLLAACERGDGIDQHAAPDIMAARAEIVAQRAALERARALLAEWRKFGSRPNFSGGEVWFSEFCAKVDREIAAPASGGAA